MTNYAYSPEVEKIAVALIADHRTDLTEHGYLRIEYLFRDEAQVTKGQTVWGTSRKVTGFNAFLAVDKREAPLLDEDVEPFFVIEIAHDIWINLTRRQRIALVDHELAHLQIATNDEGEVVLKLRAHDVEEFASILKRHGAYKPDLEHFAKIAADTLQMTFDDVAEHEPIRALR